MTKMKLIDIGANLTDEIFRGIYRSKSVHPDDLVAVLARARSVGVCRIVVTGTNLAEAQSAAGLAHRFSGISATVGVHPTRCSEIENHPAGPDAYFDALRNLIDTDRTESTAKELPPAFVAIGECGLDYARTQFCSADVQRKFFERHFELAQSTGLPMFLHCRDSATDLADAVRRNRSSFTNAVVHSFDGTLQEMRTFTDDLNLFIGINGCSMKTSENLDVIKHIPLDRLLLETDAPWCDIRPTHASHAFLSSSKLPDPLTEVNITSKKKEKFEMGHMVKSRNEPCTIRHVLRVVAALRDEDEEDVAETVYQNTLKVFFPSTTQYTNLQ